MSAMLGLTTVLGQRVLTADGVRLGELVDVAVDVGDRHPVVRRLALGRGRRPRLLVDWASVASFELGDVRLAPDAPTRPAASDDVDGLCLARDVLDTQIVDVAGKRLARVAEVMLARHGDDLCAMAVEIGVGRRRGPPAGAPQDRPAPRQAARGLV
jgi:sporulation protein YlmC with PRC-barrel domain